MLNILLITLGLAALTELAGLSLALGAFLAGMLIAETEFRYQVEEDIKPFRDVLLGLFFVSVGMALNFGIVGAHLGLVLVLLIVPVFAKLVLIVGLARLFGAPLGASLRTGFYLAQAGEFALVLLALTRENGIVTPFHYVALHLSPMGRTFHDPRRLLCNSERLSSCLVRLPLYTDLSADDQANVIDCVRSFVPAPV